MALTARKAEAHAAVGFLASVFLFLMAISWSAYAGRGLVTVTAAVDNLDDTYTLTVSSSSGMTVNDHFGLAMADGGGSIYTICSVTDATTICIQDDEADAETAVFGIPDSLPTAAWYATPTTQGHPQAPYNAPGWDALDRMSKKKLDSQVATLPIAVASGGTGATSATDARTNLGLDTMALQDASSVTITGGSVTGITDLAVADGGTGSSTAGAARTALGAQAQDALLDDLAAVTPAQGDVYYYDGSNLVNLAPGTSGFYLKTNGAGADPTWANPAAGTTFVVQELDGSPNVNAGTLEFTNGTVTDAGGGVAQITVSSVPHDLLDGTVNQDTAAGTVVRGDIIVGNATPAWARVAKGAANTIVSSDGTDTSFATLTSLIDGALGSTQGQILYRNGTVWTVLAPGTSGYYLKTQGAAANPVWGEVMATVIPNTQGGRLTLTDDTPVTTADVSNGGTLYFEAYQGDQVALYDGVSAWAYFDIGSGVTITDSGLSGNTNYDVFLYDSTGLTLELVAWTDATNRATALVKQDGVWVKTGATARRYVGTIRTDAASNFFTDTATQRYVFNADNRIDRSLVREETTASWNYTTDTWRQANGSTSNKVEVVIGLSEDRLEVTVFSASYNQSNSSVTTQTGVGLDSTTSPTGVYASSATAGTYTWSSSVARYTGHPGIGYHYLAWLEKCFPGGTQTWGGTSPQTGIHGTVRQ